MWLVQQIIKRNVTYYTDEGNVDLTVTTTYRFIYFGNSELGNVLGYSANIHEGLAGDSLFTSDYNFFIRVLPTSLTIYLPNLRLSSYNSKTQKRENILAVLPDVNFQTDTYKFVYTVSNPIFISMDNDNSFSLDTDC